MSISGRLNLDSEFIEEHTDVTAGRSTLVLRHCLRYVRQKSLDNVWSNPKIHLPTVAIPYYIFLNDLSIEGAMNNRDLYTNQELRWLSMVCTSNTGEALVNYKTEEGDTMVTDMMMPNKFVVRATDGRHLFAQPILHIEIIPTKTPCDLQIILAADNAST